MWKEKRFLRGWGGRWSISGVFKEMIQPITEGSAQSICLRNVFDEAGGSSEGAQGYLGQILVGFGGVTTLKWRLRLVAVMPLLRLVPV
jgi:hypothetical protein